MESQKEKLMRILGIDAETAEDVIKTDEMIDKGERTPYDLDPETEKMAKKMANATERKKPRNYDFSKRERKENPTKSGIIAELAEFLEKNSQFAIENVEITNKERMIAFKCGENSYEITLIQKRKAKT